MINLSIEVPGAPEDLRARMDGALETVCEIEGLKAACANARLVDDETIHSVNRAFRGVDAPTDVLSFPSVAYASGETAGSSRALLRERDPESSLPFLGDFMISLPRACAQAEEYGHGLRRELIYLTTHALWHLCGYDHQNEADKRVMRAKEDAVMDALKVGRDDERLFLLACEALENAYAPYSGYRVGACLLDESGETYLGCNIENASYGATICAERAAVGSAVSRGARRFTAIAVVGESDFAWPCGVCRQVLNEFSSDLRVICGSRSAGRYEIATLKELLPRSFGPENLNGRG